MLKVIDGHPLMSRCSSLNLILENFLIKKSFVHLDSLKIDEEVVQDFPSFVGLKVYSTYLF